MAAPGFRLCSMRKPPTTELRRCSPPRNAWVALRSARQRWRAASSSPRGSDQRSSAGAAIALVLEPSLGFRAEWQPAVDDGAQLLAVDGLGVVADVDAMGQAVVSG